MNLRDIAKVSLRDGGKMNDSIRLFIENASEWWVNLEVEEQNQIIFDSYARANKIQIE